VFDAILAPDPVVRMRAADAVEKITRRRPDLLRGLEDRVLTEVAAIDQQEVRWHVAQLLPRLALTPPQRARPIAILRGFLDDDSRIVRTFAMQALADLAEHDEQMRRWVRPHAELPQHRHARDATTRAPSAAVAAPRRVSGRAGHRRAERDERVGTDKAADRGVVTQVSPAQDRAEQP
jgi:hypothetical protein